MMVLALRNAPRVADHKKFPARTVTEQASVQQNNHANGKNNGNKNGGNIKSMWAKLLFTALASIVGNVARKIPDWTIDQWNSLKGWWDGKCIAIIGPTASEKNSLFNKLRYKEWKRLPLMFKQEVLRKLEHLTSTGHFQAIMKLNSNTNDQ